MKRFILPICSTILLLAGCGDDASKTQCDANEIMTDGACVCDASKGYYGETGACQLCNGTGKIVQENACVCEKTKHLVLNGNECVCDEANGYYNDNGECKLCEGTGKIIQGNACTCDETKHLVLSGNECVCDEANGYYNDNGECKLCEGTGKIIQGNACTCDETKHLVLSGNECVCDAANGYYNDDGECKLCEGTDKIIQGNACTCDESKHLVLSGNECVCDEANHWKSNGSECVQCDGIIWGGNCVKTGDSISFGNYFLSNDTEKEPIEWRILDVDSDRQAILLLSKYIIDAQPYHETGNAITWKDSTLRTWLNDDFINAAFSTSEQTAILETHIKNSDASSNNETEETDDKIFVLSLPDVYGEDSKYKDGKWYFNSDADRKAMATKYVVVNKSLSAFDDQEQCTATNFKADKCSSTWWLRSKGKITAASVRYDGYVDLNGMGITNTAPLGIRPALYVKSDAVGIKE